MILFNYSKKLNRNQEGEKNGRFALINEECEINDKWEEERRIV